MLSLCAGILRGYRIYYSKMEGTAPGPVLEREPRITLNTTDKAKLAGLQPHAKYRVTIKATTRVGEGMPYYTECDTNPQVKKDDLLIRYLRRFRSQLTSF